MRCLSSRLAQHSRAPAGWAAPLLCVLATILFASRSGCLLRFQQQHELHKYAKTRWQKKPQKTLMEPVPDDLSVKVMRISDRDTQAEQRRRTDTDLQASELHSCNALLQASCSYPPERTIFLAFVFFFFPGAFLLFTKNHPSAAACGSAES